MMSYDDVKILIYFIINVLDFNLVILFDMIQLTFGM